MGLNLLKLTYRFRQKKSIQNLFDILSNHFNDDMESQILVISTMVYVFHCKHRNNKDAKLFFLKNLNRISQIEYFTEISDERNPIRDFLSIIRLFEDLPEELFNNSYRIIKDGFTEKPILSDVFFDLISNDSLDRKQNYSRNFTPRLIAENIASKILIQQGSVADIGCGIGGILSEIFKLQDNSNVCYEAFEVNHNVGLLGKMFLSLFKQNLKYHICDVFEYFKINSTISYDWVVSDIPFGNKLEIKFLDLIIKLSSYKAIVVVPENILFEGSMNIKNFRQKLIDNDWLEEVISYPEGIMKPLSRIKPSILIINKNKEEKGVVKFARVNSDNTNINAFTSKNDKRFNISYEYYSKKVAEIKDNDYLLNLNRYEYDDKIEAQKSENNVKIGSIVSINSGLHTAQIGLKNYNTGYPFIAFKQLATNNSLPYLNINNVESYLDYTLDISKLKPASKNDILVSITGQNFKPTLVTRNDVFFSDKIYRLTISGSFIDKILPDYLTLFLRSESVKLQHLKYMTHGIVSSISRKDFENITVNIPSLQEQNEFVKSQLSRLVEEEQKNNSATNEIDIHERASTLEHTLGTSIGVIGNDLESLIRFFNAEGYDPITNRQARPEIVENSRLSNIFKRMLTEVKSSKFALKNVNDWQFVNKSSLKKEPTNLNFFFHDAIELGDLTKDIEIAILCPENLEVDIDKERFKILIRNFIHNAQKHSFNDLKQGEKKVFFEIYENDDKSIQIEIKNNGNLISEDFNLEKYLKTGTNKGLKLISNIIEAHDGSLDVLSRENSEKLGVGAYFIIQINKTYGN